MNAAISVPTLVTLALLAQQPAPPQPEKPPTFRSGVELLAVDVSVIDKDSRPITGLTPADFEVEVGGKRRTVARAEYIDFTQSAAVASEVMDVSSNMTDSTAPEPRTILLLVDDESFTGSDGKAVFMKLADTIQRLFPRDPLGFAPLSGRGRTVEFTTDRRPVADALRQLIGSRTPRASGSLVNVGYSEALDIARGDQVSLAQVVSRECSDAAQQQLEMCRDDVRNEARSLVDEAEREALAQLTSLRRVFENMASLPGSKYVLLVSQGIPVGNSPELALQIANAAAASGVTLHAFHVDKSEFDASTQRMLPTAFADRRLMAEGLELAVGAAGGSLHRLLSDPTNAFERIRREMSGAYRLGIELEPADADGRARSISVKVTRRGATVRAHRQVITPLSTAKLTPAERLARSLQSPLVEREIGVRLAVFRYRDDNGAGRLMISAEADAPAEGLRAAYVLRDASGKPISAGNLGRDAIIAEGAEAPTLVLFNALAPAGDHTVKLALVDAEGRAGSAIRPVSVPADPPRPLALGDLIVLPGTTSATRTRPSSRIPQGSRQASVYFELYAPSPGPDTGTVLLEIADAPEGLALVSTRSPVAFKSRGALARAGGQLRFSPAALPPGRYFARLKVEGSDIGAVRGFSVVAGGGAAALLPDESRALVPLFNVNRFLSEPLLQAVSERVSREAEGNPGAQTIARALVDGTWRDVEASSGHPFVDATLRGLQKLAAGDAAEAERAFREALDQDPEFTLALALAGGAWAAVGRDREASRSWRTSLATGVDAPFLHEHVTEALLRAGDVKGTREFLAELKETGADTSALARAEALAAAVAGDRKQAAAALASWVDAHPDDHEASFLLVLALYELKTIEKDAAAARQLEARAKQYIDRGGPRRALVARWVK